MRKTLPLILVGLLMTTTVALIAPTGSADHCSPDDPRCIHEGETEKKDHCFWTRTGAPGTAPTGGATPGLQIMTLSCPSHVFIALEYGYKDCRSALPTDCLAPAGDILVQDLGQMGDPAKPCSWKHEWAVYAPNANIYNVYFKASTWKDDDCDGEPDDWNHHTATSDGREGCYWQNYYGPKRDHNPQGLYWPYLAEPYGPAPDGKLTYCDQQIYETQWRQFN